MEHTNKFKIQVMIIIIITLFSLGKMAAEKGQEKILTLIEKGDSRKKGIPIDPSPGALSIVDINSKIEIHVDKEKVKEMAMELTGVKIPSTLLEEIDKVTHILKEEADILGLIGTGENFSREIQREEALDKFSTTISDLIAFLEQDFSQNKNYHDELNKILSKSGGEEYKEVFALVGKRIENLREQLETSSAGVNFRMGAWLKTKSGTNPVHIDGFDNYKPGEFYKYPFLTVPTTAEAEAKFKELQSAADRFNKGGVSAMLNIKENLKKLSDFLESEIKTSLTCVKDETTKLKNTITLEAKNLPFPKTDVLLGKIDSAIKSIDDIENSIKKLSASPTDLPTQIQVIGDLKNLYSQVTTGVKYITDNFAAMKDEIINNAKSLSSQVVESVKTEWDTVENTCFTNLKNFAANIMDKVTQFIGNFSNSSVMFDSQSKAALKLGDQVSVFLIDQIPGKGTIDLSYTGARNEGDEVYIKAVIEPKTTEATGIEPQQTVIGDKTLILYQIMSIKISLGMIFADPFKKEGVAFKQTFQAAPSYSALLQFGNRKSITYNRFLKVGIGINVAALDFNQDSNQEIGLGIVLSAFKNYLQVGVGRNMNTDHWYWFFGLQLPFGGLRPLTL